MVAKKKMATKGSRTKPVEDDSLRASDVVLERIESQMQVVVEAVVGLRESMESRLSALEARLSERIGVLEQVVRRNSEDIKRNSEDIRMLCEEVAQLRRDFERRAELARVSALEERVARVEAKVGIAS